MVPGWEELAWDRSVPDMLGLSNREKDQLTKQEAQQVFKENNTNFTNCQVHTNTSVTEKERLLAYPSPRGHDLSFHFS